MMFNQPDTLVPDLYNPLDWNRYAYGRYNPVKYNDPTGHFPQVFIGAAIGAIAGVAIVAITQSNLQTSDFIQAAMVGAAAGALISTGVGAGAGTALGATLIGAGVGTATSAAGYTLTAGDSYNSDEMVANALIGGATGAAAALTGPAVVGANVAKSGAAILLRAGVNALGTQASQIIHNTYFDEGKYPSGGELTAAAGLGAGASYAGELADNIVSYSVTAASGNQAAGRVAGSVAYNIVRNSFNSYYVNKGLNFIDWAAENGN
jgi:hypothetical protein